MLIDLPVYVSGATKQKHERVFRTKVYRSKKNPGPDRTYRINVPIDIREVAASDCCLAIREARGARGYVPEVAVDYVTFDGDLFVGVQHAHPSREMTMPDMKARDLPARLGMGLGAQLYSDGVLWPWNYRATEWGLGKPPTLEQAGVREFQDPTMVERARSDAQRLERALLSGASRARR